jgi:stalled ribosome rescue protein Dom34
MLELVRYPFDESRAAAHAVLPCATSAHRLRSRRESQREPRTATAMTAHQAIVWIDETEACVLRVDEGLKRESTIRAFKPDSTRGDTAAQNATGADQASTLDYFHRVARALDVADEILIVGPCITKVEFTKYMHKNEHALDPRILGVETIGSRSDAEIAAFAKLYFKVGGPRRPGNGSPPQ